MDATQLLTQDHEAVRGIFQAIRNAGDHVRSRAELFRQLQEQLGIHARVEEEIFYPAVAAAGSADRKDDAHDLVEEAKREHGKVRRELTEIAALEPASDDFVKRVEKLEKDVEHHAREEEREMFPFARKRLGADRLAFLGRQIEERKQALSPRDERAPVR